MKLLVVGLVLAVVCTSFSNCFLLGKKVKDGCDPNPCEHKGVCKLTNSKDNLQFKCDCPGEYVGVKCEGKSGCRSGMFSHDGPCGKVNIKSMII